MKREIFVFHVAIAGVTPLVWRRLEIRTDKTFWDLHCAIQDVMPWEDRHLHEFRFPTGDQEVLIGLTGFDDFEDRQILDGWETALHDWFDLVPYQCSYVYDFGDEWLHTVTLEARRPVESGIRYPRCMGGERRCPPEDVGGPGGYAQFLEAMSNRRHEEHESYRQWIGGPWDPEDFRPQEIVFSSSARRLRDLLESVAG